MEARPSLASRSSLLFAAAVFLGSLSSGSGVLLAARHKGPNFIVEAPTASLATEISHSAEKWRRDLAVMWLGKVMPNWSAPCVMTVRVGPHLGAGGATTFVFDAGEVYGWRMTIQGSRQRILDSVLPHEITHMVFASHFREPLPRWADEGGATYVEHKSETMKHRRMLGNYLRTGKGIAFNRMFAMTEYPADMMPLYAQGYSVATFLIQRGGQRKYVDFLADGLHSGDWPGAVQRHYGISSAGKLQNTWLAWVRQGWPAPPSTTPSPTGTASSLLAARDRLGGATGTAAAGESSRRRPRPAPNLLWREPKQHSTGSSAIRLASSREIPGRAKSSANTSANGWRPARSSFGNQGGGESSASPASVSSQPTRSQLAHPQPFERSRQIILEYHGK